MILKKIILFIFKSKLLQVEIKKEKSWKFYNFLLYQSSLIREKMIREERKKKNRRARKSCKIQSTTLEIEAKRVSSRNVREFEIRIVNSGWHSSSILANPGATFSTITAKMTPQITLFLTLKRFRIEKSLNGKRKFNPKLTENPLLVFFTSSKISINL